MSNLKITLNKTLQLYDDTSSCVAVCLSVVSTENMPYEIFVHKYIPTKNKYQFQHTAYYDELDSVADTISNTRAACDVRMASLTYKAQTLEQAETFVTEVCADIKRLLTQCKFFADDATVSDTELLVITTDNVVKKDSGFDEFTMGGVDIEL